MSSSRVRDGATEIERCAYCGCAGYCLYAGVLPAGLTVRLRRGIHVQRVLCHGGLARIVWSWVRVGRRVLSRNAILRGCELCRWVRLGHGFWGCWGVLITLKKRDKVLVIPYILKQTYSSFWTTNFFCIKQQSFRCHNMVLAITLILIK